MSQELAFGVVIKDNILRVGGRGLETQSILSLSLSKKKKKQKQKTMKMSHLFAQEKLTRNYATAHLFFQKAHYYTSNPTHYLLGFTLRKVSAFFEHQNGHQSNQ
jgi:hypothetical protein